MEIPEEFLSITLECYRGITRWSVSTILKHMTIIAIKGRQIFLWPSKHTLQYNKITFIISFKWKNLEFNAYVCLHHYGFEQNAIT